jgi:hypothetical protein
MFRGKIKNPFTFVLAGRRQKKKVQKRLILEYLRSPDETGDKNIEFPFISFEDIVAATDHFSDSNMLGKGGFGKVYKVLASFHLRMVLRKVSLDNHIDRKLCYLLFSNDGINAREC